MPAGPYDEKTNNDANDKHYREKKNPACYIRSNANKSLFRSKRKEDTAPPKAAISKQIAIDRARIPPATSKIIP